MVPQVTIELAAVDPEHFLRYERKPAYVKKFFEDQSEERLVVRKRLLIFFLKIHIGW